MHGNMKPTSHVQCKYVLQIHIENDITNILSRLDYEYEAFGEIYPSDGNWWLQLHTVRISHIHSTTWEKFGIIYM